MFVFIKKCVIIKKNTREINNLKTITIFNRKGGVGKTSLTAALALYFGGIGKKVLCIDLDSQMNLSLYMSGEDTKEEIFSSFEKNIVDVICNDENINLAIVPAGQYCYEEGSCFLKKQYANVHFIPGAEDIDVQYNDVIKDPSNFAQYILHDKLEELDDSWDIILIDNSPGETTLSTMSLVAADSGGVMIPVTPDSNALIGLENCKSIIKKVQKIRPNLKYIGCVLNNYKSRESISQVTYDILNDDPDAKFSGITIRSASKIPYSIFTKEEIINMDRYLKGLHQSQKVAEDIIALGEYILKELGE